jgi:hypothetical protein
MWTLRLVVLLLTIAFAGAAVAEGAASIVLVKQDGKVCVGGTDVIWVAGRNKVLRWHQKDGAVSEIHMPDLNHIDVDRGAILGCLVRPNGEIDLYYEEYFNIPGTRARSAGWDANRRVQTIWMSGDRHRVLLQISVPEGGDIEDTIRIVPELGVTVHGQTVERVSDGLRYDVKLPEGAYILGVWPASRSWPVNPPDLVLCYAYPQVQVKAGGCIVVRIGASSMEQRSVDVDSRDINLMNWTYRRTDAEAWCALKGPDSPGYGWPNRVAFDCQSESKSPPLAEYPVANGWVGWRLSSSDDYCRQRFLDAEALIVQAQCFMSDAPDQVAQLPRRRAWFGLVTGYEYPATSEWTMSVFSRDSERPIVGRLLPVNR